MPCDHTSLIDLRRVIYFSVCLAFTCCWDRMTTSKFPTSQTKNLLRSGDCWQSLDLCWFEYSSNLFLVYKYLCKEKHSVGSFIEAFSWIHNSCFKILLNLNCLWNLGVFLLSLLVYLPGEFSTLKRQTDGSWDNFFFYDIRVIFLAPVSHLFHTWWLRMLSLLLSSRSHRLLVSLWPCPFGFSS